MIMNEQNNHQAEQLEKMIQEVKNHSELSNNKAQDSQQFVQTHMNILDLPPRREVHQKDDRRFKLKMGRALRRFLLIIILLLILVGFVVFDLLYGNRLFNI